MPVLGYDSAGSSNYANIQYIYGNVDVTDELGGYIKNFHCAILNTHSTEKNVKLAIVAVDQGTGDPTSQALVEQGEFTVAISDDNSFPAPEGNVLSASTKYYIGIAFQNALNKVKYDVAGMQGWYKAAIVYADQFPDPYHSSGVGPEGRYSWSIWIDYQYLGMLGYNTVGASNQGSSGVRRGSVCLANIEGIIRKFHVAIATISGTPEYDYVKLGVTNCDAGGNPLGESVVEQVELVAAVGNDINVEASGGTVVLGEKYYLPFISKHSNINIKYDNTGGTSYYKSSTTYEAEIADPITISGSLQRRWSIWIDYEYLGVFGYDVVGVSARGNDNISRGTPSLMGSVDGIVKNWHCAIDAIGSPADIKLALYNCDQSDGDPSEKALVEQVEYIVAASDNESAPADGDKRILADTWYFLCIIMKNANTLIKYDNFGGDKNYWYKVCVYGDQYPSPADAGWEEGAASLYSIWIDYEKTGVLGYNIAGTSSHSIIDQYRGSPAVVDSIGGEITRFHVAIESIDVAKPGIKMCVADCAQGDGDPSNCTVIEQVEFDVAVSDDEWVNAAGGNLVLADTKYYIAYAVEDADTDIKYDVLPGCWYDWGWAYGSVFPDPLDVVHVYSGAVLYSLWVDYGAVAGEEFIRSISDTVGVTDSLLRSGTFVREVTNTIGMADALSYVNTKIRKIVDAIGIIDIINTTVARVKEIDCFGVCRIVKVKAKEKLISAIRKIDFFQHPE